MLPENVENVDFVDNAKSLVNVINFFLLRSSVFYPTTTIPHNCRIGAVFAGMRNTSLFSGFKTDSVHIGSLFQSEKQVFI